MIIQEFKVIQREADTYRWGSSTDKEGDHREDKFIVQFKKKNIIVGSLFTIQYVFSFIVLLGA